MDITIYHNPKCSTSRKVLGLIREAGYEPIIVEYLKTPLSRAKLAKLIKQAGVSVRDAVRTKEGAYTELKLADKSDAALLDAVAAHPILMQRPIVASAKGARICRPPEVVQEIL